MAGPVPLNIEKDRWCQERLDFVCAVVNDVDRESLKAQLEICETDEDAEGLMQSLLWLQDHNDAQLLVHQNDQEPQHQENPNNHEQLLQYNAEEYPQAHHDPREHPQAQVDPAWHLQLQNDPGMCLQAQMRENMQDTEPLDEDHSSNSDDSEEYHLEQNAQIWHQPMSVVPRLHIQTQINDEQDQTMNIENQAAEAMRLNVATGIAGMSGDELIARLLADEANITESEDTSADEQLARELSEEAMEHEETEEDRVAAHLAALVNMFPDAEPNYLEERCTTIKGVEEEFEKLVEELLEKKSSEPRMSGYLKQQRQAIFTPRPSTSTNMEIPEPLLDPAQDITANELHECSICYEEQVLEKNMATCNAYYNFHKFCIDCIRKHVAAQIGLGHSSFRCMNGYCESEFSWRTLQRVMEPVVFEKIQERKQQDEIRAAGIDNLESCPFCNFMIIMPNQENKVLECLNPECLKESCRLCKDVSHIPYRCSEIEKEDQKDARTVLENRMAEAMIRECPKCMKRFIIEAGCNRMVCPCGSVMCYLCKTILGNDYNHFEQRQVASNKCPLWSNPTELHTTEVREAAVKAKLEMNPSITLLHDPTADIV
nr:uncharacterized protein LOC123747070 [Procambarus clarkii]